jgi:hypothetical protein
MVKLRGIPIAHFTEYIQDLAVHLVVLANRNPKKCRTPFLVQKVAIFPLQANQSGKAIGPKVCVCLALASA